ncbi:hypothetical protein DERP_010882 [Dermatophagoides pteronyssinus]|uniref:Uncharacterized protein n=1 Tax=Dermatophagoides pteronyssinus TaxID=6956 RepID=A0ABQ8JUQ1_DERPT|nr:hypothetical protein DERP_010882 [Dermatophagoides pteronyssinus]
MRLATLLEKRRWTRQSMIDIDSDRKRRSRFKLLIAAINFASSNNAHSTGMFFTSSVDYNHRISEKKATVQQQQGSLFSPDDDDDNDLAEFT